MNINIQKCSNVTVIGHHGHKNCKPVYCIDTGEMYASSIDAATANGVTQPTMSNALTGKTKTCNGKRYCYVAKMMEHLEEINEANRIRAAKVAAYDAEVERQNAIIKAEEERRNAIAKAEADLQKYEARVAELRRKLQEAENHLSDTQLSLYNLRCDN